MADFGIVQTGFNRKRYIDILSDMQARARANFGEGIEIDTNKPLGKFLDVNAWQIAELWEKLESIYNAISIDTAEGTQLDILVKYKGLTRYTLSTATGQLQINGIAGTLIPIGFIGAKEDGTSYSTTESGTIAETGYITLNITCTVAGSRGNAEVGAINTIVTPITGVTSITNILPIFNGQDDETDVELRQRFITTVGGLSTVESIRASVAAVEGVVSNVVLENVTMETDENGLPPKSFEVFVYGGADQTIAQAILDSKAAGIQAYGTTIIETVDVNGFTHDIGFTRANAVEITVNIRATTNQYFPSTGINQIKTAIVNYIGGQDSSGTQYAGLRIGEDVITSFISSVIWPIGGITDISITIARDGGTPSVDNIDIGQLEIARTNFDLIEVTIVS